MVVISIHSAFLRTLPPAVVLIIALFIAFIDTSVAAAVSGPDHYSDVKADDPNRVFINYTYHQGLITGFPDGKFHPDDGITRAQAAVIMVKAAGLQVPAEAASSFMDVPASHWATKYISAATEAGYLKGFPDGTFRPDEKLTRAQGISLIMRLCSLSDRAELPVLKDVSPEYWAAHDIGTAITLEMIGLSADKQYVYPQADMTRAVLARSLAILLTTDPGRNQTALVGTISEIKGEIKLVRGEETRLLTGDADIIKGDSITAGPDSHAKISYPDGSSALIEENTAFTVKESKGRHYIQLDGTPAVAIDYLNLDVKTGILYGALATKRGTTENSGDTSQSRSSAPIFASRNSFGQLAESQVGAEQPWYKTAQKQKVKVKVDMPWGVAAVRGTFFKVTVNQDGSCKVSCLIGSADVSSSQGTVPLGANQSSAITGEGNAPSEAGKMDSNEVMGFNNEQQWIVNTALRMDKNQEAPILEMVLETPGTQTGEKPAENQVPNLQEIIDALHVSGIQLTPEVVKDLQQQLEQLSGNTDLEQSIPGLDSDPNTSPSSSSSSNDNISGIAYYQPGIYGPEDGTASWNVYNVVIYADNVTLRNMRVTQSVMITQSGCSLENMIIEGDLILAAGIGEGDVTLTNTSVNGSTMIQGGGGGSTCIRIVSSKLGNVIANKSGNAVRMVAEGSASIGSLQLLSGAILEETGLTGSGTGFSSISISGTIPAGTSIILRGSFASLDIGAPNLNIVIESGNIQTINISAAAADTTLTIAGGASVQILNASAAAIIYGTGQVVNAVINVAGVVMEQTPLNWNISVGITAVLGGNTLSGIGPSNACEVLGSVTPALAVIATGQISASVPYETTSLTIVLSVSPAATWKMYSDSGCTTEIVDKIMNLDFGANTAYIKAIAQDSITSQAYALVITRNHSSDCTVANTATAYTIDNTANTISDTITINTNLTTASFLGNLTKHAEAAWKVVDAAAIVTSSAEFDAAVAKVDAATLLFGDKLAVKAGDGTIKVYTITVLLGDPVIGNAGSAGNPGNNLYGARYIFTWGKYRYFVYDSGNNPWPPYVFIYAWDDSNVSGGNWSIRGGRYLTGVTVDFAAQTVVITTDPANYESGGPLVVPWNSLRITQP
ncbi:MAG: S-layer homology domain-containing protein [Deltaproteobacteria bacterium]